MQITFRVAINSEIIVKLLKAFCDAGKLFQGIWYAVDMLFISFCIYRSIERFWPDVVSNEFLKVAFNHLQ